MSWRRCACGGRRHHPAYIPDLALSDALPEGAQPLQAERRWIAGNDRPVDGADRYARQPVRLETGFLQGLVDARLVGSQRAATLQDGRDPAAALGPREPAGRLALERFERLIQRAPVSTDRMAGGR